MKRKGFFGVWTVPIIFIITVTCAIIITHIIPHFLEWLGYETRPIFTIEKPHTVEQNTYDKKPLQKQYLSPKSIIQIKTICATCKFDLEPWKDDKTHMVSHGICAYCYRDFMVEKGLPFNQHTYASGLIRMEKAIRWAV